MKAKNRNAATSSEIAPAILWVRSSFTNSFTVTCSSFSGFNWSGVGLDDRLLDFKRLAMCTKISSWSKRRDKKCLNKEVVSNPDFEQ